MVMQLDTGTEIGQSRLRAVFGAVPTSVVAVCAVVAGDPVPMVFIQARSPPCPSIRRWFRCVSTGPPVPGRCCGAPPGSG